MKCYRVILKNLEIEKHNWQLLDKDDIITISYFQNEGVARNEKGNYVEEK